MYRIAQDNKVTVDILIRVNNITDPTRVREGTIIKVPYVYSVKRGDTLYSISRENKISLEDLVLYNPGLEKSVLKIGQKIILLNPVERPDNKIENTRPDDSRILWPHGGKRENMSGKLNGVMITGVPGDNVISVSEGSVIWAGPYRGFGKMVLVQADDDLIYGYAGNDRILVEVGQKVFKKTPIAVLGQSSHDGAAKVYFFIYLNGKAQNPVDYLCNNY
ncbi:MAG: LysM peptidoglycan-binding domain-containing protein [Spirochaetales bacterium]|nr:LysM peptidoglycan-binding domain-containing protein [Spirochaetales bacterium]